MHIKEQAEKRLTANSKLSDDELNSKLKRECAQATRNYLCGKCCNDVDRKAAARTLVWVQDVAPGLDVDPRMIKCIGDSDYMDLAYEILSHVSCDELPLGTETEHEQHTILPEHQVVGFQVNKFSAKCRKWRKCGKRTKRLQSAQMAVIAEMAQSAQIWRKCRN
jgi:hypothetical protein